MDGNVVLFIPAFCQALNQLLSLWKAAYRSAIQLQSEHSSAIKKANVIFSKESENKEIVIITPNKCILQPCLEYSVQFYSSTFQITT